jgi:hypothetical protein
MKPELKTFTALIVIAFGLLIGLMEANIACQVKPKPKQADHYYVIPDQDTYPYAPFNIVHSELKAIDTIGCWSHKWDVKAMNLRGEDIK